VELTAFTSRLGEGQGWLGPGVFVLGDAEPGRVFEFDVGDYAEVTQPADLTAAALVMGRLSLRVPSNVPAGFAWEASLIVDGAKYASVQARPGRERLVTDLAANVSKLAGVHVVGVRLELVLG